jgi:nitroreductase
MNKKNGFLDVIMTRRSIRDFKEGDVPPEDLEKILRAGVMAPSVGNRQPWRFHVMKGGTKAKFVEILKNKRSIPSQFHQVFVRGMEIVPLVIAVENSVSINNDDPTLTLTSVKGFGKIGKSGLDIGFLGSLLGTAASIENMLLAVHSLGYGGVWMSLPPILEAAEAVIKTSGGNGGCSSHRSPCGYSNRLCGPLPEACRANHKIL